MEVHHVEIYEYLVVEYITARSSILFLGKYLHPTTTLLCSYVTRVRDTWMVKLQSEITERLNSGSGEVQTHVDFRPLGIKNA